MMQKRVIQIVTDSFGSQFYSKAMECLKVLREESVKVLSTLYKPQTVKLLIAFYSVAATAIVLSKHLIRNITVELLYVNYHIIIA